VEASRCMDPREINGDGSSAQRSFVPEETDRGIWEV
jgi:hypothetical protein